MSHYFVLLQSKKIFSVYISKINGNQVFQSKHIEVKLIGGIFTLQSNFKKKNSGQDAEEPYKPR